MRMRDKKENWKQKRLRWEIQRNFCIVRTVKHWYRLPREGVLSLFQVVFKD